MMRALSLLVAGSLLSILSTPPAESGVVDSPLPNLDGKKSKHLFTVPGVLKHANASTAFVCTSLEKTKTMFFAVQTFDQSGNAIAFSTRMLNPGETRSTDLGSTIYSGGGVVPADSNSVRTSRILGTSTRVMCAAMVLEPTAVDGIPGSGWALPLIKKTTQKGD